MTPQNIQQFPSGEIRIYRVVNAVQVLHAHIRAEGDADETDHVGKTIDEMNSVPVYEAPVNVEPVE